MSYNLNITNTTMFLVPPTGIDRAKQKEHGFVGAYLGDRNKPEMKYDRGIFMLFRPPNMTLFQEFLEDEKLRTPQLVDDYDYPDGYVVVVYMLDDEFAEDYDRFLKGEYSKFSSDFKNRFTKTIRVGSGFGKMKEEPSWQWRIFKKDPEIRKHWEEELGIRFTQDMEVWSSPTMNDEMLDIAKIKGETKLLKR